MKLSMLVVIFFVAALAADSIDPVAANVTLVSSSATMDNTPTKIHENIYNLNYVSPYFRAEAEVEFSSLKEGEIYTVGWVQAVTHMELYNIYPLGVSGWKIPELDSGESRAVSDADGRWYPWYGVTTERSTVKGPSGQQKVRVSMNDNFSPTISWAIPVGQNQPDTLQSVHRHQSFVAWLVVKNEVTEEIVALKSYLWRALINVAVDCSRPKGERAKLLNPLVQDQPTENFDLIVPQSALVAPNANEAQKFFWRKKSGEF